MEIKQKRLPLTALRTFEAAARLQSFKQAAAELYVTPTTVSNQIRQLERDWGCLLFIRKTRQLVLTDEGRSLSNVVSRSFEDIRKEINTHINVSKKTVSLAVGPIFGARWLIPRLSDFRRKHPNIDLVLHHGPRIASAEYLDTAVAVDWGEGLWPGLAATHLLDIRYSPIISPDLVKAKGGITNVGDLQKFPLIHQFDRSEWSAWLSLAGEPGLGFKEETVIIDSNVVVQAAIDGLGVALGIFPLIQSEIETGRLVCPFELARLPEKSFYLLHRPGAREDPEIDLVCKWLQDESLQGE